MRPLEFRSIRRCALLKMNAMGHGRMLAVLNTAKILAADSVAVSSTAGVEASAMLAIVNTAGVEPCATRRPDSRGGVLICPRLCRTTFPLTI